jgi:hypothetical protein
LPGWIARAAGAAARPGALPAGDRALARAPNRQNRRIYEHVSISPRRFTDPLLVFESSLSMMTLLF